MTRLEPRTPSRRIVLPEPERVRGFSGGSGFQDFWPTVEVTERVTVLHHFSWGTDSATYEIVAKALVDTRNGWTDEALTNAEARARDRIANARRQIEEGHPR